MTIDSTIAAQALIHAEQGDFRAIAQILKGFIDGDFNAIASVTATATEINKLGGVTGGTVTASKALVVDSNKDLASLRNLGLTGNVTFNGGTLAALGTNLATSAPLVKQFTAATGADDTVGVSLPTAAAGLVYVVVNTVANKVLKVYPQADGTINAIAAHGAFSMAAGTVGIFIGTSATQWYVAPVA